MDKMFLNFYYDLVVDRVFRGDCSTKQVYEEGAKDIALSVVGGINCKHIILCYPVSHEHFPISLLTLTKVRIYTFFQHVFLPTGKRVVERHTQ